MSIEFIDRIQLGDTRTSICSLIGWGVARGGKSHLYHKEVIVIYYTKCVKFWLKLLKMENYELPKSAYNMSLTLCDAGKNNYCLDMVLILP